MRLHFVKLAVTEAVLPFRFSFKHALAERSEARTLILELHAESGQVGYGQVLPREYLTGETCESAWEDLKALWWPRLRSVEAELHDRHGAEPMLEALREIYFDADRLRKTASYAGLDVAAVDAYARAGGVPGCALLPRRAPGAWSLTAPLGGSGVAATARKARLCRWAGFKQFKLKLGLDDDAARVRAARAAIGDRSDLRGDANAAWSVSQAVEILNELRPCRLSSIEQPVARENRAGLLEVQRESGVPVMADESLCTLADARELLGDSPQKRVLLWNVRLGKCGGFSGALEQIALAERHGVGVHLGVLVGETSLLAAAQRALLGVTEYAHAEYGFPRLLLKRDPFRGDPGGYFGTGAPLAAVPGLGVRLSADRLARAALRREEWC